MSATSDGSSATPQGSDDNGLFPASCNADGTDYTVWYSFTPSLTTLYTFTTCPGLATGETVDDTVLEVVSSSDGTCGGTFTSLACQDSEPSCRTASIDPSKVSLILNAGTTYYVIAGHWLPNATMSASHGAYAVQVQRSNAPSNDTCAGAVALPLGQIVAGTTAAANDDYQTPATAACYGGEAGTNNPTTAPGRDVVYTFTAPADGKYSIRWVTMSPTNDLAGQDPVIYASNSCPGGGGTVSCLAGANRITANGLTTSTGLANNRGEELHCLSLTANQQIYVFFDDGASGNGGGTFGIEATPCYDEVEPNDTPATATPYTAAYCGTQEGYITTAPAYHCVLGSTPGVACQVTTAVAGSPSQPINCGGAPGLCFPDSVCQTGPNVGNACVPRCVGGSSPGTVCTASAQCAGGGTCATSGGCGVCTSGTLAGNPCTASTQCGTGGVCAAGTCGRDNNEGDVDFWNLGSVAPGSKIYATAAAPSANDMDLRMRITTDTDTLGFDDDDGHSMYGSFSPVIAGAKNVAGGNTYARVSKTSSFVVDQYHLYAVVEPPIAQAQQENGEGWDITYGWPADGLFDDPVTNGGYIRGTFFNGTDSDCYRMFAHKGDDIVWFGDSNPDRTTFSPAAGPSIPQIIIYDANGAGISNFVFTTNATIRNNGPVSVANNLISEAPDVTSFFQHWRATYTGSFDLCFYPFAASGVAVPGPFPAPYAGAITLNCGPVPAAGPGTTTTDVSISKTGPAGPIATSGQATYTIVLTNVGSDIAQSVTLNDDLSANLRYLGLTVDDGFGGNNTACLSLPDPGTSDAPVNCTTLSLAPGASVTYQLTVQVADCIGGGVQIDNTATVSTESTDPNSANDSSTTSFTTSENDNCTTLACDANGCITDHCFLGGVCQAGACVDTPRNCDDNNVCTADSCVSSLPTGCVNDPTPGTQCDDGNACTSDFCDPIQGCVFPPAPAGTACNDFFNCTLNDQCDGAGNCAGQSVCDDHNPCTDDFADEFNNCACSNFSNLGPCDDGNACTTGDTCDDQNVCQPGTPTDCDDGNACTLDACDPATGCTHTPITCDDGNACTSDSCNPASGCVYTPINCNDGNACTTDSCNPATGCVNTPVTCNDGNACTDDSCNPASGCVYTNNTAACDDGNACTSGDTCSGGSCHGGGAVNCDDGNPCTDDSCNPASGCVHTNNTAPCSDGNACTTGDVCGGGSCHSGAPVVCNDGNACTDDSCNPASGCVYTNNTAPCDDGNLCTVGDTCGGGSCHGGAPVVCSASDQCHVAGSCNPASGACSNPNAPDGTSCDDGNPNTSGDSCQAGTCVGGASCPTSPDPKTKGYYKKLCGNGNHGSDSISDADAQCVASISATFSGISTAAQVCAVLSPGGGQSNCDKDEDQLMALALNLCKHRLCSSEEIDSNCGQNTKTVGASFAVADGIFANPSHTDNACNVGACLGNEINNGRALKLNSVNLSLVGGQVKLQWTAPVFDDGTAPANGYTIWRRPIQSWQDWVQIGTTTSLSFTDVNAAGLNSWEYQILAVEPTP
ncbi:MAG TPA: hypothetical protein VFV19_01955 [Candidatus Polarisedimenticolaceae bacterium]|nr:hypothetical protein [Candidatus Polarisedimenticolaceae bacterium]